MPRYIDADTLYEKTAEWEARALEKVKELNSTPPYDMTDEDRKEWRMWTAILGERTAFKHDIADAPTADVVEVVRCKDCKFFETDHLEAVNGIPLIVAHEICTRWGLGCKTSADGFCFLAERRDDA